MRGVWIEIKKLGSTYYHNRWSLPMRGVWIEIKATCRWFAATRHSPCGECGLKFGDSVKASGLTGHSPCGECGLKLLPVARRVQQNWSLPMRGVWIEIEMVR